MNEKFLEDFADAIALRVVKKIQESSKERKVAVTYHTAEDVCEMLHVSK